jgi:DNA-binding MarR family transcriptional regulator
VKRLVANYIRNQVLSGNSPLIRELLLLPSQLALIQLVIGEGSVTTEWLSKRLKVSSQNASAKLNRLHKSGYLSRKESVASSGGIEFIYETKVLKDGEQ